MSKHTPTPWRASKFQVIGGDGSRVAHTGVGQLLPHRTQEAIENADLIARAVNSHKHLIDALEASILALRSGAGAEEKMNAVRDGKAAVTLAKGGA